MLPVKIMFLEKTEKEGDKKNDRRLLSVVASRSGLMGTKELQENTKTCGSLKTTEGT